MLGHTLQSSACNNLREGEHERDRDLSRKTDPSDLRAPPYHRAGPAYRCTNCASSSRQRPVSHAPRHWRTPTIHSGRVVEGPRDAGGRRSVGVLAHLEQHAALFLGPLFRCRWARTDFRRRQAVVRGLHTTDWTGRDHGRWVPAEWPLVSRVWVRAGRLCPPHELGTRRWWAAHAGAWSTRPPRALRA